MIRKSIEREAKFYRKQLELIASAKRRTWAKCIAQSALTFWDELQINRRNNHKANNKATLGRPEETP